MAKQPLVPRLLKLLSLAVVAYLGVVYGSELWERFSGGFSSSTRSSTERCLQQAERALRDFRDRAGMVGDESVEMNWREATRRSEIQIRDARAACSCEFDACDTADGALGQLEEIRARFAATVTSGGTPRRIERELQEVEARLALARTKIAE